MARLEYSIPNHLFAIISWLCQYYSVRSECILVFRIVVTTKSSYSVLLKLSGGEYHLYLVD